MRVFSGDSSNPRSLMNCSTRGFTSCSSTSFDLPVMMKSSAKSTKLTFSLLLPRGDLGNFSRSFLSNPSNVKLASTGEQMPPYAKQVTMQSDVRKVLIFGHFQLHSFA